MYKATVRWMIKRNVRKLNAGDYRPTLAMYADDATLAFPGDNSWARQFRIPEAGRNAFPTHRSKAEIEAFLRRYADAGIQMHVEDILVNGPPWHVRAAVIGHVWAPDAHGNDVYTNRAVLVVHTRWGKIQAHEDFEDSERSRAFDSYLAAHAGADA